MVQCLLWEGVRDLECCVVEGPQLLQRMLQQAVSWLAANVGWWPRFGQSPVHHEACGQRGLVQACRRL